MPPLRPHTRSSVAPYEAAAHIDFTKYWDEEAMPRSRLGLDIWDGGQWNVISSSVEICIYKAQNLSKAAVLVFPNIVGPNKVGEGGELDISAETRIV